jgi:hypothetical protein
VIDIISQCPICGQSLEITKLRCSSCNTTIEGQFSGCIFCNLDDESKTFLEIFIKNRGNIREVEKYLGISYPTVRNKLDCLIKNLYREDESAENKLIKSEKHRNILIAFEKKDINIDEALEKIIEIKSCK